MIKYLSHKDIDKNKWDACVNASGDAVLYGLSWYLDLVTPGWSALVKDNYKVVMPLPLKSKWGLQYVYHPIYAQQLGVFSPVEVYPELLNEFLSSIPSSIKYIDTQLRKNNDVSGINKVYPRTNYELELDGKYDEVSKLYRSNTLRNIKKSAPLNDITEQVETDDFIQLKKHNDITKRRNTHYDWLRKYVATVIENNAGKIVGSIIDGKLVAAAMFGFYKDRIYYLIPVSSSKGKENMSMFCILDHVIKTNCDKMDILDFEGSNIPGIARFFEGFGAVKTTYYNLKINRLPFILRILKK